MTAPSKLIFREWKKPEVTFELHGWRTDKALAYVVDDKGQPKVLEFVLPAQFNEHAQPTPVFAQHPPTEVAEIRLVPPPCRADQGEAHALRVRARANTDAAGKVFPSTNWDPARWELVRLTYDEEILILRSEDDEPLKDLLTQFKEEKVREYVARKKELYELLELVRHRQPICGRARYYVHIVSNGYEAPSSDSVAVWLHFLDQERIKLDIDFGQGDYTKGFLQWTPEDARRHPDIRDPFLQSRWAKENGLDLQAMADERKRIAAWTGIRDSGDIVTKLLKDALGDDLERLQLPKAPSPATLEMAKAGELEFGAAIRFRVTFGKENQAWLTGCTIRNPEPEERHEFGAAQDKIVTMETVKTVQGQVLTKLDSVEKKTDKVLSGVQTLTGLVGEQSATNQQHHAENIAARKVTHAHIQTVADLAADVDGDRAKLAENPLGSREAIADYFLTMDALKIKPEVALGLALFGYGFTRKQCAQRGKVSEATIKRALKVARDAKEYAPFFARTREQKLKARKNLSKPEEVLALVSNLIEKAEDDPEAFKEEMRSLSDQIVAKARRKSDDGTFWDAQTQRIS